MTGPGGATVFHGDVPRRPDSALPVQPMPSRNRMARSPSNAQCVIVPVPCQLHCSTCYTYSCTVHDTTDECTALYTISITVQVVQCTGSAFDAPWDPPHTTDPLTDTETRLEGLATMLREQQVRDQTERFARTARAIRRERRWGADRRGAEAVGAASSAGVSGADGGEGLASWDSEEEEEPDEGDAVDRALSAPGLRGVDAATFFASLGRGQVDLL